MARYPRTARSASIKCISCNAPVTRTVEKRYVCVNCGDSPVRKSLHAERQGVLHGD